MAFIEFRYHVPQDHTFDVRKHNFMQSASIMKFWLNQASAQGGGDQPEAVADALYAANTLSWRPNAAKISVLIADAPPHGLVPSDDNTFKHGSPKGHDPM